MSYVMEFNDDETESDLLKVCHSAEVMRWNFRCECALFMIVTYVYLVLAPTEGLADDLGFK